MLFKEQNRNKLNNHKNYKEKECNYLKEEVEFLKKNKNLKIIRKKQFFLEKKIK